MITFLLEHGCTPCGEDLGHAIISGNQRLFAQIWDCAAVSARQNPESQAALSALIQSPSFSVSRHCLIEMVDMVYCTASDSGVYDITENLDIRAYTVVQAAAGAGDMELLTLLLDKGADVNAPAYEVGGATPLQAAVLGGHIGMVRLLLAKGAQCDAAPAPSYGRTALEAAAEHGRLDILILLLHSGASIEGPRGQIQFVRAFYFARLRCRHAVATHLKSLREWTPADDRILELFETSNDVEEIGMLNAWINENDQSPD
jgi:hypothetical protein